MPNRKVKCRITGETIRRGDAYCVEFNTKKQYYTSEALYVAEVSDKKMFESGMKYLLGVKPNMKMPVQYNVKVKKWHDDDIPYRAMALAAKSQRSQIDYAMKKSFPTFNAKLAYILKVIESGLITGVEELKRTSKQKAMVDWTDLDLLNASLQKVEHKPKRSISDFL